MLQLGNQILFVCTGSTLLIMNLFPEDTYLPSNPAENKGVRYLRILMHSINGRPNLRTKITVGNSRAASIQCKLGNLLCSIFPVVMVLPLYYVIVSLDISLRLLDRWHRQIWCMLWSWDLVHRLCCINISSWCICNFRKIRFKSLAVGTIKGSLSLHLSFLLFLYTYPLIIVLVYSIYMILTIR